VLGDPLVESADIRAVGVDHVCQRVRKVALPGADISDLGGRASQLEASYLLHGHERVVHGVGDEDVVPLVFVPSIGGVGERAPRRTLLRAHVIHAALGDWFPYELDRRSITGPAEGFQIHRAAKRDHAVDLSVDSDEERQVTAGRAAANADRPTILASKPVERRQRILQTAGIPPGVADRDESPAPVGVPLTLRGLPGKGANPVLVRLLRQLRMVLVKATAGDVLLGLPAAAVNVKDCSEAPRPAGLLDPGAMSVPVVRESRRREAQCC
jgi:hypothetical protein